MPPTRLSEIAVILGLLAAGAPVGAFQAASQSQAAQPPSSSQGVLSPEYRAPTLGAPAAQDLEALRRLEADYVRAEMEDNATIAKAILADDYIGIKSGGGTVSKADILRNLSADARSHPPINIAAVNMQEHLFDDVACITYTKVYSRPGGGASYSENVLHIFTKRNGTWRLQMSAPTPVPR